MVFTKELELQQNEIIKKYINDSSYTKEVKEAALKRLEKNDFYVNGLYELLLNSISSNNTLDSYAKRLHSLENPEIDGEDPYVTLEGKLRDVKTELIDTINRETDQTVKSIKAFESKYVKDNKQLLSSMTSIQINGKTSEKLVSLYNTILELARSASKDISAIEPLAEDSLISYNEKLTINPVWLAIKSEKNKFIQQMKNHSIDTEGYELAYQELSDQMLSIMAGSGKDIVIDGPYFIGRLKAYFDERHDMFIKLYQKLESESLDIANRLVDSSLAKATINGFIINIKENVKGLEVFKEEFLRDGIINIIEKGRLRSFLDEINYRVTEGIRLGKQYKVQYTGELEAVKLSLDQELEVNEIFKYAGENTPGNHLSAITDKIEELFKAEIKVYTAIQEKTNEEINSFTDDVKSYNTKIDQIDKRITLSADSVEAIGNMVKVNRAYMDMVANGIRGGVSETTLPRDISNAIEEINSMGENLYIVTKSKPGYISNATGKVNNGSYRGSRYSDWIKFPSQVQATLSISKNTLENNMKIAWYTVDKKLIRMDNKVVISENASLTVTSPPDTMFCRVEVSDAANVEIQFEMGSKRTPYKLALHDTMNNVVLSKNIANIKIDDLEEYEKYLTHFNKREYSSKLSKVFSDDVLSGEEKMSISTLFDEIVFFHDKTVKVLNDSDVKHRSLDRYQTELMSEVFNILADTGSNTTIRGLDLQNKLRRYMEEIQSSSRQARTILKKLADEATDSWKKSSESAIEAEDIKNKLLKKSEQSARLLSSMRQLLRDETIYDSRTEESIMDIVSDSITSAEEKVYLNEYVSKIKNNDNWFIEHANIFNVGKSKFIRVRDSILDYMKPLLTVNSLNETSEVIREEFILKFQQYFQAKSEILLDIITAAEAEYELLQLEVSNAINLARSKNEDFILYQGSIENAKNDIGYVKQLVEDIKDNVPYILKLTSSNGDKFTNGEVRTTLSVRVYKGSKDITDTFRNEHFVWSKRDKDGVEDLAFKAKFEGRGHTIEIDHTDVDEKAIFNVEVFQEIENG